MFYLVVQTILLLAIAFILGAVVGSLLRRWFGTDASRSKAAPRSELAERGRTSDRAIPAARVPHVPAVPLPAVEPQVVPQPVATPPPVPVPPAPETVERPTEIKEPVVIPGRTAEPAASTDEPAVPETSGREVGGERDNLKLIRGIGPQNERRLNAAGVERFAQIAAWTKKEQREMGERLSFPGRIEREEWVEQAKRLAKGSTTDVSNRASTGRVKTSTSVAAPSEPGTKPPVLEAPREGKPDKLALIEGVGDAIERKLNRVGIYHFDQIAAWTEDESVWVGKEIGFPGRIARENWVSKARSLLESGAGERAPNPDRGQIKTL